MIDKRETQFTNNLKTKKFKTFWISSFFVTKNSLNLTSKTLKS